MEEQLSLFDEKHILLNTGTSELISLHLESARKTFQRYKDIYGDSNNMQSKLKIVDFLLAGLTQCPMDSPEEPAGLYRLWNAFADYAHEIHCTDTNILSGIKDSLFKKIMEGIDQWDLTDVPFFMDNVPTGYIYMEAGDIDHAIGSLQASIAATEQNALLYGYLGDAYTLREEPDVARRCYLEALLAGAEDIDWNYLRDGELAALRELLIDKYNGNEAQAGEWLPSHAVIRGLLPSKTLRLREEMKRFVDEYRVMQKAYSRDRSPRLGARLFIRSIILCGNEALIKLIQGMELVAIRKEMKEIDSELFLQYMKSIKDRKTQR